MSNLNQKCSLEIINKSMQAVEMIRIYKKEKSGDLKESSNTPTDEQVENLEKMITAC